MAVKFLTSDYMQAATSALAADPQFQEKITSTELRIQFEVGDTPSGETIDYFLEVGDASAMMQLGKLIDPDATIKSSLETAMAISKGDLNVQMALMTGKIKVDGSMAVLMLNQGLLVQWAHTMSGLDIEY